MRGMSRCRICGKRVPSIYRKDHENRTCIKMRIERGDYDVIHRKVLPRVKPILPVGHPKQKRLFEVVPLTKK